jgi:RNA polymerase sigma-70 factor (ECF subfamily)
MEPLTSLDWSQLETSEATLIARCRAGEQAACEQLVAEHQAMVFQLGCHLLGSRDEAYDLSQEVFLRVFRTIDRFRADASLKTWIYRIAINQASNRRRFWSRRHRLGQVSLDAHVEVHGEPTEATDASSPHRILASKELAARLTVALDALPFDQRTVIILREVEGLSYDEIAQALDIAVGTVKSRLTRARQALRASLGEVRL